jgi:DNA gyrase subunit A
MGVKFVTPKNGDAVAVVTRSVEAPEDTLAEATSSTTEPGDGDDDVPADAPVDVTGESPEVGSDATIDENPIGSHADPVADSPPESEA